MYLINLKQNKVRKCRKGCNNSHTILFFSRLELSVLPVDWYIYILKFLCATNVSLESNNKILII